jgi:hypothetical protein
MKKFRIVLIVMVLLAVLIPSAVFASYDVYYCSIYADGFGDGSYEYPWACSTEAEFDDAVDLICDYGGGILYEEVEGGYYRHTISWYGKTCEVTSSKYYHGYPPDTGITLPPPFVISAALVLGLSLFAVGLVVYRKRSANNI